MAIIKENNDTAPVNTATFPELDRYIGYMQAIKGRSPLTVKAFNDIPVDDVDAAILEAVRLDDFYAFITYVSQVRKGSAATRSRKIASLKSFFR